MSIDTFERREAMLDLREKLLLAEQQRLAGEPAMPLQEAQEDTLTFCRGHAGKAALPRNKAG